MSTNTQNLSTAIATQLVSLREKKGSIGIDDLSAILENVAGMFEGTSALDVLLRDEIMKIAHHIETTKNEIVALAPDSSPNKSDTAAIQLDAVMKATEQAAHTIMDAADEIQNVIAAANIEQSAKDKITEITARIYEACNFQDLTGQRIKKVMRALEFTEARIRRLMGLFASDGSVNIENLKKVASENKDSQLLNGPQLPGTAPSQAEIDALFGDLK